MKSLQGLRGCLRGCAFSFRFSSEFQILYFVACFVIQVAFVLKNRSRKGYGVYKVVYGVAPLFCLSAEFHFFAFRKILSNLLWKNDGKSQKSKFWGSQDPPKILPKRLRNRCPKRHAIFHCFLFDSFLFFTLRFLENMHFASTGARFLRFSLKSRFCKIHAFLVKKTYQKPFQNEVRTL